MTKIYSRLLCIFCCALCTSTFSQPGVLDQTFGNNGKVFTGFDSSQISKSIAIQPDGKIIVAGGPSFRFVPTTGHIIINGSIVLTRYQTNGLPDSSFGVSGIVNTPILDFATIGYPTANL